LGIQGVTLLSYPYAWAENSANISYPERYLTRRRGFGQLNFWPVHGMGIVSRIVSRVLKNGAKPVQTGHSRQNGNLRKSIKVQVVTNEANTLLEIMSRLL
jgi:hypothetical protein